MLSQIVLVALSATSALAATGRLTFWNPGLGACGNYNGDSDFVVAVGVPYWTSSNPNNDALCSQTASITYNGKTVEAKVVDKCMGCGTDNLDASPAVFQQFAGLDVGVLTGVTWTLHY